MNKKMRRCQRCRRYYLPGGRLGVKVDLAKAKRKFWHPRRSRFTRSNRPPDERLIELVEWSSGLSTGSSYWANRVCDACATVNAQRFAVHKHIHHPRREKRAPALGRRA